MAEKLLQGAQVRAVFHHQRRGGVTKQVTRTAAADADRIEVAFDDVRNVMNPLLDSR